MRKPLLLALITLTSLVTDSFAGEDDLFSDLQLQSTSAAAKSASPPEANPAGAARRTNAETATLQTALLAAGYSARVTAEGAVSVEITRTDWSARLTIAGQEDGRQLRLALQLMTPDANTSLGAETLRALLNANGSGNTAFFALAEGDQRIELVTLIAADSLDSDSLRTTLEAIADTADRTRNLWNVASTSNSSVPATVTPAQPTTPSVASTPTPATSTSPAATPPASTTAAASLNGKWVASPTSAEAFAMQLNADATFRLVHVKGTNNTQSKGTFTLAGTTLTLKGDTGTTLTGTVTRTTEGFTLALKNAGGQSVTLTFKSST